MSMRIDEAEALHLELLQSLPGTGNATSALTAVVELHAPEADVCAEASCRICLNAQEESMPWPCVTVAVINAYAHIDGIPAGAEAWWRA